MYVCMYVIKIRQRTENSGGNSYHVQPQDDDDDGSLIQNYNVKMPNIEEAYV